jgi:uncharacterized protein (TIGR02611 family)
MGRWGSALERIRATRTGRLTLRIIIGVVGVAVVLIGLVLVPLPGPGWLIVLAGLAILSLEFEWAQRLLHFTRTQLERWWRWLERQPLAVRLLAGLVGFLFVGTVLWFSWTYGSSLLS